LHHNMIRSQRSDIKSVFVDITVTNLLVGYAN
jgi:hypothetical protein